VCVGDWTPEESGCGAKRYVEDGKNDEIWITDDGFNKIDLVFSCSHSQRL
jgi:hypothetical protein